ncbi:MAG: cupin domain-containing protein [Kiritimatiellae bacterium]|nr:cupin domain-containing protein [Kiritimatiellia bacterium]
MNTIYKPSACGGKDLKLELILEEELGDKCGLYAKVTIPAGSELGYHEHHGEGESYFVLSGEAVYNDNGTCRVIKPGDSTWTPDGSGHGVDNSKGAEDFVFMALIVKK